MKVLWITNLVFPTVESLLVGGSEKKGSGGWLYALANEIKTGVQLYVAAPSNKVKELTRLEDDGIIHFVFPIGKGNIMYNKEYEIVWKEINSTISPDIVHIHGTEYSHGLAYIKACGFQNVVVSIQGVMAEIAKHYNDGLSNSEIIRNLTLHDLLRGSLFNDRNKSRQRAFSEPQILTQVNYILGRTTFDQAYALSVNPHATYFHCGEILRDTFYNGTWKYDCCTPHTIFVSSARYPLKGFHMLLRALPHVIKEYPDVRVLVAGGGYIKSNRLKEKLSLKGYQKIIDKYINNFKLQEHIAFLGALSAEEMKEQMLKANLFLLSSSNENSSNALGEAQLLGVPCLASYVGGTPDMIPDRKCGELYNYYELSTLAYKICKIFESSKTFDNSAMIQNALTRHDREKVKSSLMNIYLHIFDNNK